MLDSQINTEWGLVLLMLSLFTEKYLSNLLQSLDIF